MAGAFDPVWCASHDIFFSQLTLNDNDGDAGGQGASQRREEDDETLETDPMVSGIRCAHVLLLSVDSAITVILRGLRCINSKSSPRKLLRLGDEERVFTVLDDILDGFLSRTTRHNLRTWFEQEKSADEVLALLKLDDGVEGLLSRRNMKGLTKYISWLNVKNPDSPVTMVETLSKQYGDGLVAKMLELGKHSKSSRVKKLAKTLQKEQYRVWGNKGQNPEQVFLLLRLDDVNTLPLGSTVLDAWVGFLKQYKVWHPSTQTTTFEVFRNAYGDRRLASYLYGASTVPQTKGVAENMQAELFTFWFNQGIKPKQMFRKAFGIKPEQVTPTEKTIKALYETFYKAQPKNTVINK